MRARVECNVKMLELGKEPKAVVDDAVARGVDVICVIDTFTADGAWEALKYVRSEKLPLCIVAGVRTYTAEGSFVTVYGAVDKIIVPCGSPLGQLTSLVEANGGLIAELPGELEIEVTILSADSVIEALRKHDHAGTQAEQHRFVRQAMYPALTSEDLKLGAVNRVSRHDVAIAQTSYPDVSIVIPVFNAPRLLQACMHTLATTAYPGKCSLVLVDNASDDPETLNLLNQYAYGQRIRFDAPQGFATAVNTGIRERPATYYVLLNQDVEIIDPAWLKHLVHWMECRPQCGIAGAKLLFPNRTIQHAGIEIMPGTIGRHRFAQCDPNLDVVNAYERVQAVTGAVFCIRHAMTKTVGLLDEDYQFACEDTAYCLQATMLGWEVWYVPDCVAIHHESAVRKTTNQSARLREWIMRGEQKLRREWGAWIDLMGGSAL